MRQTNLWLIVTASFLSLNACRGTAPGAAADSTGNSPMDVAGPVLTVMPVATPTIPTFACSGGNVDPSFGATGVAILSSSYSLVVASGAPDGGLFVTDRASDGLRARHFAADGSLDSAFGVNGFATIQGVAPTRTWATAADQYGRLLVFGTTGTAPSERGLIARLTSSGTIDASFGDLGIDVTSVDGFYGGFQWGGVTRDGRIVAGGFAANASGAGGLGGDGPNVYSWVERFDNDGAADASFGNSGNVLALAGDLGLSTATIRADSSVAWIDGGVHETDPSGTGAPRWTVDLPGRAVSIRTDGEGRFMVLVEMGDAPPATLRLYRLQADGSPDSSFGGIGYVEEPEPASFWGDDLLERSDGSWLLAGGSIEGLAPDGRFAPTFGPSGLVNVECSQPVYWLRLVAAGTNSVYAIGATPQSGAGGYLSVAVRLIGT